MINAKKDHDLEEAPARGPATRGFLWMAFLLWIAWSIVGINDHVFWNRFFLTWFFAGVVSGFAAHCRMTTYVAPQDDVGLIGAMIGGVFCLPITVLNRTINCLASWVL
jgi:hypothetical protein